MEKRWGVLLQGHEFDLLTWSESLHPAFDPLVEKRAIGDREEFVLFSRELNEAADHGEVREMALSMIAIINGAMAIHGLSESVQLKAVGDFTGSKPKILIPLEGHARMRSRASAVLTILDKNGKIVPPPSTPSPTQDWIGLSRKSDHVADLLNYASRSDSWFDVYKMIEAASVLAGSEAKLVKMCGPEVKIAKRRANEARHHRVAEKGQPLSFAETQAIAFRAADIVLGRALRSG